MIILAIVALSAVVLTAIAAVFVGLPSYPAAVTDSANLFISYFGQGMNIFYLFVYPAPVKAMLAFTVAIVTVYEGYKLLMWVVKKIPMFGVSD